MRAFFSVEQLDHDPKQFMREGRICDPADVKERTQALLDALDAWGIPVVAPDDYGLGPVLDVHAAHYLDYLATAYQRWQTLSSPGIEVLPSHAPYLSGRVESLGRPPCPSTSPVAQAGYYLGDLSSPIGPHTYRSALRSAHCAVAAADEVVAGAAWAYALCRPSGHHVRYDRANGFCYINNAAVAVQRLRGRYERVAVMDVDVHHGDGTQQIFYRRADVMTVSMHADPVAYYPFYTGYANETGYGDGQGFNLNLPLPHGSGDPLFLETLDIGLDRICGYGANALVLSLGFDAHVRDPLGVLKVGTACFEQLGRRVAQCELPVVVVQEGGYAIDHIGPCLAAFLSGLPAR